VSIADPHRRADHSAIEDAIDRLSRFGRASSEHEQYFPAHHSLALPLILGTLAMIGVLMPLVLTH
jgi:hypothetical protein